MAATNSYFIARNGLFVNNSFIANTVLVQANNLNVLLSTNTTILNVSGSANIAGNLFMGTTQVNSTFAGLTSNNSNFLGGLSLSSIQTQFTANSATAYSNAVSYVTALNVANVTQVATAYSNAVSYVTALNVANVTQVATAYSNAVSYVTAQSYANTLQLSSNSATAYSNAVSYVTAQSFVNTSVLGADLANYVPLSGAIMTGGLGVANLSATASVTAATLNSFTIVNGLYNTGLTLASYGNGDSGTKIQYGVNGSSNAGTIAMYGATHSTKPYNFEFMNFQIGGPITFGTLGTERARISANGFIGLGTPAPLDSLHVNGGSLILTPSGNTLPYVAYSDSTSGNKWISRVGGGSFFYMSDGASNGFDTQSYLGRNYYTQVKFGIDSNFSLQTYSNTHLAVKQGTKVGIGTSSPSSRLWIEDSDAINAISVTLKNQSSGGASYQFFNSSNIYSGRIAWDNNNSIITVDSIGSIKFSINSIEFSRFSSNGNFGVGTTSPSYILDVANSTRTNGEIISTQGSSAGQFRAIGGNFGVIHRNDGSDYYILATNSFDQYGTWKSIRPYAFSLGTGLSTIGNGLNVIGDLNVSGNLSGSYVSPGSSTNPRILNEYLSDTYNNVKSFGNVGAGQDATVAFTAAINAANINGKHVYVPPGYYIVTAALPAVTNNGVRVIGSGKASVIQVNGSFNLFTFSRNGYGINQQLRYSGISGLVITGYSSAGVSGHTGGYIIVADFILNFIVDDMFIDAVSNFMYCQQFNTIIIKNTVANNISGTAGLVCFSNGQPRNGYANDGSDIISLKNVIIAGYAGTGALNTSLDAFYITGNIKTIKFDKLQLLRCNRGIVCTTNTDGTGNLSTDNQVNFNWPAFLTGNDLDIESFYGNGIDAVWLQSAYISGFYCYGGTGVSSAHGMYFGSHATQIKISQGKAQACYQHGVVFDGATNCELHQFDVFNNSLQGANIHGGIALGNASVSTFTMIGGSSGKNVGFSYIENQSYGIISTGGTHIRVNLIGVDLSGNQTGGASVLGATLTACPIS